MQNRFQEYAPNYFAGETTTELLDFSLIKSPDIAMFAGQDDETCPFANA